MFTRFVFVFCLTVAVIQLVYFNSIPMFLLNIGLAAIQLPAMMRG